MTLEEKGIPGQTVSHPDRPGASSYLLSGSLGLTGIGTGGAVSRCHQTESEKGGQLGVPVVSD